MVSQGSTHADDSRRPPPAEDDLTGRELAGCRILKKLGQGAMGTVYLAEQISLERRVALKVLDPKFSRDLVYIERFEREAQACARLVHFNIVQVYDFGRTGETYYIVSEFVQGSTVQSMIEENAVILPEDAVELILQTTRGLAVAQEAGIVHRDIKPENLMLNHEGVVKITDFGLAKTVSEDAGVTQSGMIVGTPFYMSPEQAKGLTLDGRSDLYSLGVTWFHMVTGRIPFDGDSVIAVLLKHISGERPDPAEFNPAVPRPVCEMIQRLMAREPEDRYQTAEELIEALERLQAELRDGAYSDESIAPADTDTDIPPERRKRYKRLRRSLIASLAPREAPQAVLERMQQKIQTDGGVFVESSEILPEGSLVEVRFSVPGRAGLVQGLGLVRWVVPSGPRAGMGITFLRVQPVEAEKREPPRTAIARRARLAPAEVMEVLTKNQLSQRLLKYYYANLGRLVTTRSITSALGVAQRMLKPQLEVYKSLGLAVEDRDNPESVSFIWPDDRELQNAIVDWIQEYGLR